RSGFRLPAFKRPRAMRFPVRHLLLLGICTLALSGYLCAPARAECAAKPESIFFVTDRQPLDDNQLFSGEWGTDANHQPVITAGVLTEPVDKANESRCSSRQAFIHALKSQFKAGRPRQ